MQNVESICRKQKIMYNGYVYVNPATTVFFLYTEDGWGRFLPHVEYTHTAII